MFDALLDSRIVLAVLSTVFGIVSAVVIQRLLNKRGLLTYTVRHDRIATSGADAIWGSVQVLWNGNPVGVLFVSTVELHNDSLRDYENVHLRVFSSNTMLLNERTEYVGTTRYPRWTEEFAAAIAVQPGQVATQAQLDQYSRGRDYVLSTLNRGQVVRLSYLTIPRDAGGPSIWLDLMHKGVRLEFRVPRPETLGVPQPLAGLAGLILGILVVTAIALAVDRVWFAATIAFIYGLGAQVPGALVIRLWRSVRRLIAD